MSAAKRHKKHHHEEHENHERWLVSGYDMMTLLFAVFVVLFAISSTNVSKVKELRQSLQEAFSGPVLTGGQAMMERGNASESLDAPPEPPLPSLTPIEAMQQGFKSEEATDAEADAAAAAAAELAAREEQDFQALKRRIDKAVREAGLAHKVSTTVNQRGLKVRLLTDKLFFDSGSAVVNAAASRRSARSAASSPPSASIPCRWRATRTTGPSTPRSSRPTGSCPARAQARSCSSWSARASAPGASRSPATPTSDPAATNATPRAAR